MMYTGLVRHESEQVALMALERLHLLLVEHCVEIHDQHVMQAEHVSPAIEQLLEVFRACGTRSILKLLILCICARHCYALQTAGSMLRVSC